MRIGILSQWYDPEPGPAALPGVLARGLAGRGHDVQVLTGFPNYPTGVVAEGYRIARRHDEQRDGVNVRRVALYTSHDASALKRIANYGSFGASAVASGLDSLRGIDALWVNYSPITVAWPMWIARYAMRIPTVVHVLDLWPDTLRAAGFAGRGAASTVANATLGTWCKLMYRSADSVAYISPGVGTLLKDRGVPAAKLHYVPMWADESVFRPTSESMRAELGIPEDTTVLLYAGVLGEAQGLTTLVEACARVTDPRFLCLIAGSGISESSLREHAAEVGASNVRFLGRLPQADMTRLMATADISYVSLRPDALSRVTMPSKTQAGLAAGRPLLVAAEGDVASVVGDNHLGFIADPADPASIADAIRRVCAMDRDALREMGTRAQAYYETTFSMDHGVQRVETLLEKASVTRRRTQ